MNRYLCRRKKQFLRVLCACTGLIFFITTVLPASAFAQTPMTNSVIFLSPAFSPALLKGITVHPDNPLMFDFIIQKGDEDLSLDQQKEEYTKLIRYFLASLAIPSDDQWVNLSPYEKDRIISENFARTEMGRDLLEEDYLLKQITASLMYPEKDLGKDFWSKVYAKAHAQFGTTSISVDTFNKVWIVPGEAVIYEKDNTAYVIKNHLKVMLEEDYLALSSHQGIASVPDTRKEDVNTIGSQVVREVLLPALEKEVNEGRNFARLRQIYSGMILAAWYKRSLKESLLGKIYADQARIKGVDQDPKNNEVIYQNYVESFQKGVFNYIKVEIDKFTNKAIPRKYFSGGMMNQYDDKTLEVLYDSGIGETAWREDLAKREQVDVRVALEEITVAQQAEGREEQAPRELEIRKVVLSIVQDLQNQGVEVKEENGRYLIREAVANKPEKKIVLENGTELYINENGILVIIDKGFEGIEHAGRGTYQLAVYASSKETARHELAELEQWLWFAETEGIMTEAEIARLREGDRTQESLGERLRARMNEGSDKDRLYWQNKIRRFYHKAHIAGLRAEGKYSQANDYERQAKEQKDLTTSVKNADFFISSDGDISDFDRRYRSGIGDGRDREPPIDGGISNTKLLLPKVTDVDVLRLSGLLKKGNVSYAESLYRLGALQPKLIPQIIAAFVDSSPSFNTMTKDFFSEKESHVDSVISNVLASMIRDQKEEHKLLGIIGLAALALHADSSAKDILPNIFEEYEISESIIKRISLAVDQGNENALIALCVLSIKHMGIIGLYLGEEKMDLIIETLDEKFLKHFPARFSHFIDPLGYVVSMESLFSERIRKLAFQILEKYFFRSPEKGYNFFNNLDFIPLEWLKSNELKSIYFAKKPIEEIIRKFEKSLSIVMDSEKKAAAKKKFFSALSVSIISFQERSAKEGVELEEILENYGNWKEFDIFRPLLWEEKIREHVLGNRLANKEKRGLIDYLEDKGFAIIIYPKSDWNAAFLYSRTVRQVIKEGYSVLYYEVGSPNEMIDAIKDATNNGERKASLVVIGGHGSPESIEFGRDSDLTPEDLETFKSGGLLQFFNHDAKGILESCSTGGVAEGGVNMVQAFANAVGIDFYGPDRETSLTRINFESVERTKFTEGAETVKASPSDALGGIDFSDANLNLQIKRDGRGIPLPIGYQNLEHIQIEGLVPIIINIQPMVFPQPLSKTETQDVYL